MAVRFIDGFDHYATAELSQKWDRVVNPSMVIDASGGRRGGGCLKWDTSIAALKRYIAPEGSTWIVGFAFQIESTVNTAGSIFAAGVDGATQIQLHMNTSEQIEVRRGDGGTILGTGAVLNVGQWYWVEFAFVIGNAGSYELRLDGTTYLSGSGVDTQDSASLSTIDEIGFGYRIGTELSAVDMATGSTFVKIDDFYIADDNTFRGDSRVDVLRVTGAGNTTELTPSAGSNFQNVDETSTDGDTTYNAAGTSLPLKDTYALGDLSHNPSDIHAVQICAATRKDDDGARTVQTVIRSGGADTNGTERASGSRSDSETYGFATTIYTTNPATGLDWTASAVDALEAGARIAA